uniref:Inositol 1,4,5-trisphosphate receptor n=1 Tax=Macrostomum lignano TaxID=282301 RepID=A0A1I8GHA8_9PLAT
MAAIAEDVLCIGDTIALYSDDVLGYVYALQSSSSHAVLAVNSKEDRVQPRCPDAQVLSFKICSANRYKLQKAYRKLAAAQSSTSSVAQMAQLTQAKIAAAAEEEDNAVEQRRQKGKKVLYGQMVQLQHVFTGKFVHISTQNTSPTESSNMQVTLSSENAAFALFRVMPRFKVKGEGDLVQIEDQVVLESVKSPGQFLHVSRHKFEAHMPVYADSYELNLSVRFSGFTLIRRYHETEDEANKIRAGQPVRFFHTELEAYLVCEGTFNEPEVEDVHLRVRAVEQTKPKTMFPPTSAICYWQLEFFEGCISGDIIKWEQQVRIRHMCTRKFLIIDNDGRLALTEDCKDARAVFRLHPVLRMVNLESNVKINYSERDEIEDTTYCRIEHVVTGNWLHGSKEDYSRKTQSDEASSHNSMAGLVWSQAPLKKVEIVSEMQFDDAFTIYSVEEELVRIFNFAAGCVPFIQKLCLQLRGVPFSSAEGSASAERKQGGQSTLNAYRSHTIANALKELRDFMIVNSEPVKKRQKLLRNLRIVELLVRLLQTPFRGGPDQQYLVKIFVECYEVLYTYLMGDSRKNELYIAKHIDFFRSQVVLEEEVGLNAAHMIMELIKDNRKIVDRIPHSYVDEIIELLKQNKNFRYLELLSVLCVCDGLSMPENQNYITDKWLVEGQSFSLVFFTDLGQTIGKEKDKVFVSVDNKRRWVSLAQFAKDYQKAVAASKTNADGSVQITHVKSRKRQLNKRKLSPEELKAYGRNKDALEE